MVPSVRCRSRAVLVAIVLLYNVIITQSILEWHELCAPFSRRQRVLVSVAADIVLLFRSMHDSLVGIGGKSWWSFRPPESIASTDATKMAHRIRARQGRETGLWRSRALPLYVTADASAEGQVDSVFSSHSSRNPRPDWANGAAKRRTRIVSTPDASPLVEWSIDGVERAKQEQIESYLALCESSQRTPGLHRLGILGSPRCLRPLDAYCQLGYEVGADFGRSAPSLLTVVTTPFTA